MSKNCEQKKHKSCGGKCENKLKDCQEKCHITAEKNLLNVTYIVEGAGISNPDISATYEIVIFNNSDCKLCNLSVIDSMMGLQGNVFGDTGNFGGELRPYFTNVTVTAHNTTLIPNNFDQIVLGGGELLAAGSYIPARSVCNLLVRITGRGFLLPRDPLTGQQIVEADQISLNMCIQNTALIRGNIHKKRECGCHATVPMFPIYVKSGEKTTNNITYFGLLPNFNP
jgi:hypothetical protein